MKPNPIAIAILLASLAFPARAETVQDDVRCILLSGIFIKQAKDEKGKQIARLTGAFYLGRIDGRADTQALTDLLSAQSKALDPKTAGPQMDACAAKLARAQAAMNTLGRTVGTAK